MVACEIISRWSSVRITSARRVLLPASQNFPPVFGAKSTKSHPYQLRAAGHDIVSATIEGAVLRTNPNGSFVEMRQEFGPHEATPNQRTNGNSRSKREAHSIRCAHACDRITVSAPRQE